MLFDELAQKQLNNLRKQTCTVSCEFAKNVSRLFILSNPLITSPLSAVKIGQFNG